MCKWPLAKVKKWPWPSILTYLHFSVAFRSQAANVLKNRQFSLFPIEKPKLPIWPCHKIGQSQPRVIIYINYDVAGVPDAKYQVSWKSGPPVLEKKFLKVFEHFWAWWPSWSCDLDHLYKLSFHPPSQGRTPHEIWLWLVKRFQRRRRLKMWTDDDGRRTTDAGPLVYYKLTLWAWRLKWAKNVHPTKT